MLNRRNFIVSGAALPLGAALVGRAAAGEDDGTVRLAFSANWEAIDPYYDTTREGIILNRHVYDNLLFLDPATFDLKPLLATGYTWVDDVTLDFDLRHGVTFHNGDPFGADDVVATFKHVLKPDSAIKIRSIVQWIKDVEKIADDKVRFHLAYVYPTALQFFAGQLGIYSGRYLAKASHDELVHKPIGTGPYKVTAQDVGKSATLDLFEGYYKDSPKAGATIKRLFVRVMPDATTQLAELMTGSLDWMWRVSPDLMEKLAAVPTIKTVSAETMRFTMIAFDANGRAGKSPIQDVRVRRAFIYAIDRKSYRDHLIKGESRVLDAACFPTQFGCTDDVTKYAYDPAKAKALLAEAGYPDGFEMTMLSWSPRSEVEAIVADLAKVGIRIKPRLLQSPVVRKMMIDNEAQLVMLNWGSYSINDVAAGAGLFFDFSGYDLARDPEVRDLMKKAASSTDPAIRKENYKLALQRIADQVFWLPLTSAVTNYAYDAKLVFHAPVDEIPTFYDARWT